MTHVFWLNTVMMVRAFGKRGKFTKRKILMVSCDLSCHTSTGNLNVLELEKNNGGNTHLSSWVCGKRPTSAHGLENHTGSCLGCWNHSGICSESPEALQCSRCIWQCFPSPKRRLDSFVPVFINICQVLSAQSTKTAGEINVKLRGCLFGVFFFKAFSQSVFVIFFENKMVKALQITTLLHRAMCQLL